MAYIIVKELAYSIKNSIRKMVTDCGKIHMMCDATLCLCTGRSEQIKTLLMHRTVGTILAYLNCYVYTVFAVVGRFMPGSDLHVCL